MKKSLSRAISAVLATCMTLSALPSAAVAAEKVYSYKSIETVSDGLSFTADYAKGSSGWGTQTYIYEYTPGFIHAKSMVSDDKCAVVGSINLDYRSLYLHFENAVYFSGCDAVKAVKEDGERTFADCKCISLDDTRQSFFGRLVDAVLRVFETLV